MHKGCLYWYDESTSDGSMNGGIYKLNLSNSSLDSELIISNCGDSKTYNSISVDQNDHLLSMERRSSVDTSSNKITSEFYYTTFDLDGNIIDRLQ